MIQQDNYSEVGPTCCRSVSIVAESHVDLMHAFFFSFFPPDLSLGSAFSTLLYRKYCLFAAISEANPRHPKKGPIQSDCSPSAMPTAFGAS